MKKGFLVFAGLLLVIAYGCKKDVVQTTQTATKKLTAHNGLLHFTSSDYYDEVINSLSQDDGFYKELAQLDFKSLENSAAKGKELVKAEFLQKILNPDNAVIIGNYIYKLNLKEEKVYVLPLENIADYKDLADQNISNTSIKKYDFSDDVINMAEAGANPAEKGPFCGESGMGGTAQFKGTDINVPGGEYGTMGGGVYYDRYGIFFSMYAKGWLQCDNRRIEIHLTPVYYHQKCGGTVGPYYSWNYQLTQGSTGMADANGATYQSYQGSTPLNALWFRVVFMAKNKANYNDPYNPSVDVEIRGNY